MTIKDLYYAHKPLKGAKIKTPMGDHAFFYDFVDNDRVMVVFNNNAFKNDQTFVGRMIKANQHDIMDWVVIEESKLEMI